MGFHAPDAQDKQGRRRVRHSREYGVRLPEVPYGKSQLRGQATQECRAIRVYCHAGGIVAWWLRER